MVVVDHWVVDRKRTERRNEGCFPPDWTFLPCTSACASTRVFCTSIVQKCEVCTSSVSSAPALQPPVHCTRCTLQFHQELLDLYTIFRAEGMHTPIHPYSSLESQGSVRPFSHHESIHGDVSGNSSQSLLGNWYCQC